MEPKYADIIARHFQAALDNQPVGLREEDHRLLSGFYDLSERAGMVMPYFPLLPESLLGARYFTGATESNIASQLLKKAQREYPGTGPEAVNAFFHVKYAHPAVVYEPKNDLLLLIFKVPEGEWLCSAGVLRGRQIAKTLEGMLEQNERHIRALRNGEALPKGFTAKLVHKTRAALEKAVDVFERATRMELADNLRTEFRAAQQRELMSFAPEKHKDVVHGLMIDYVDHNGEVDRAGKPDDARIPKNKRMPAYVFPDQLN